MSVAPKGDSRPTNANLVLRKYSPGADPPNDVCDAANDGAQRCDAAND